MAPETEVGKASEEWINSMIPKLRYKQDFTYCWGHSKKMVDDDGKENGIHIRRPYIRLFSTGIEKIYRMQVLNEKMEDTVYSKAEDAELEKFNIAMEEEHNKSNGGGWK